MFLILNSIHFISVRRFDTNDAGFEGELVTRATDLVWEWEQSLLLFWERDLCREPLQVSEEGHKKMDFMESQIFWDDHIEGVSGFFFLNAVYD